MIIRSKAGIDALPEGRIRELAEATVKKLGLNDFIEMEVDSAWPKISEFIAIKTRGEQINISYPKVEAGRLSYRYLEFKQKSENNRTKSSYLVREDSLKIKQYGVGVGQIEMSGEKDFFELSKKAPQIQKLLQGKYTFNPMDIIPKIRKILGCSLKEFAEFKIEDNLLLIENGEIVELGERTEKYRAYYSTKKFSYRDSSYTVEIDSNSDRIEISVEGQYEDLKDVSIKDIRKIADEKKKEMKEKLEKLSKKI